MESWQTVWRNGLTPLLSTDALQALRTALQTDDPRLIQGANVVPSCDGFFAHDWPIRGACAICYAGWQGDRLKTIGGVEEYFGRLCFEADQRLGDPAACRWFLNFFDDTPRAEMRQRLLAEVELSLTARLESTTEVYQ